MNLAIIILCALLVLPCAYAIVLLCVYAIAARQKKQKEDGCSCGSCRTTTQTEAQYPHKAIVGIDGMSCSHCASRVESAFAALGDCTARVNLEQKNATVLSAAPLQRAEVENMLAGLGFTFVDLTVLQ